MRTSQVVLGQCGASEDFSFKALSYNFLVLTECFVIPTQWLHVLQTSLLQHLKSALYLLCICRNKNIIRIGVCNKVCNCNEGMEPTEEFVISL